MLIYDDHPVSMQTCAAKCGFSLRESLLERLPCEIDFVQDPF